MTLVTKEEALAYHEFPRPGKLEVVPSKPCATEKDLSMAYSPGVAEACKAIVEDPSLAARYTGRSNLVAVISNGSAVLGLGNIGPLAGKPVMEGKGVLFKLFADIDSFDLELDLTDPDKIIETVQALEPTFGGINLEDIKAPDCFHIEEKLRETMGIPVFHDDQHGTAVISGAGLYNAMEISGKRLEDCKIVILGAGAAAIASGRFYLSMGVDPERLFMFDSRGLIHKGRTDLNRYKQPFARSGRAISLEDAMKGADMFLGLSRKDLVTREMVKSMSKKSPVIFACANPDPEISYEAAKEARPDCIMGTGRTDYPNQINNVSGFPFIFRGALDVEARQINEPMKIAASKALAALAREPVPVEVEKLYGGKMFSFGPDYIIPKPLDPRILLWETPAVAQAAMESGVAAKPVSDLEEYRKRLAERLARSRRRIEMFTDPFI